MVAKAAWLEIEPEISLEAFLASEEIDFFQPGTTFWKPDDWTIELAAKGPIETSDS